MILPIDFDIFRHHLVRSIWLAENFRPFEDDPRIYGDYLTESVYLLLTQSSLPRATNLANALARMAMIPEVVKVARATIGNPPRVKVETATVDRRDATYLYRDGSDFVFMDSEDYEQHPLPEPLVGRLSDFLLEGMPVQIAFHDGVPLYLELPVTVELLVASTEPGLQGDRSSAGTKPATMETGAEIQVPLFINTGDKLKVDSRDGNYLGRVNA